MNMWIVSLASAYLLGSIPFGYVLVRVFRKQDIRASGSGNIGATNVIRFGARGLGIATLLLDLLKGYAAVELAYRFGSYDLAVLAAVMAIFGHVFPIWLRFRGGKGVATALGVFLALVPWAALCVFGVFLAIVLISRYVSLASIVASASFPLFGFYFVSARTPAIVMGFLFIPFLIIVKHHGNIRRLLAGTESRVGSTSKAEKVAA